MPVIGGIIAVLVVILVLWVIHLASWLAHELTWLLLIAGLLWTYALWLHHRRKMAEVYEHHIRIGGKYRRVHMALPWPKQCVCGAVIPSFWAMKAHDRPAQSACAAHLARVAAAEQDPLAEGQEYRLTVEDGSQKRYHGASPEVTSGGTDSLTDQRRDGIEAADR